MAQLKNDRYVPSIFEMYLACELLNMRLHHVSNIDLLNIIEAHVRNVPLLADYTMDLRKHWFQMLILGLSKEEVNELVNK